MMEDAALLFGLSFCYAYAMVMAAASLAAMTDVDAATTTVSGLSYYCFAVADAAVIASASS